MKSIKLDHELAQLIVKGTKHSTWRLYDDKNLRVDDRVVFIDKFTSDHNKWNAIGEAVLDEVHEKRLSDVTHADYEGNTVYESSKAMLTTLRSYYGDQVTFETPAKIIRFTFHPYKAPQPFDIEHPAPSIPDNHRLTIYADGGSRGNPGPSAAGYVLFNNAEQIVAENGVYLGVTTNNQAEYAALKLALEEAIKLNAHELAVYMDSMLVVNQMKGIFKIKNRDLWPIHDAIVSLTKQFKHVSFAHVPRELNKAADAAVNRALDAELGIEHT
jgi:ribonuclease HI